MAGTAERVLAVKLIGDVSSINKSMKGVTGRFKSMKHEAVSWTKAFALTKVIDGIGDVTDALGDAWGGFKSGQRVAAQLGNTWKNLGLDGSALAGTLQKVTDSTLRLGTSDDEAVAAFNNSIKRTKDYNESLKELTIAQDLVASGSAPNLEAAFKMIQQASKGSARVVDKFGLTSTTAAGRVDELGKRVHGAAKKAADLNPMKRIMNSIQESAEGFVGALSQGNLQGALDAIGDIGKTLQTAILGRDKFIKDPGGNPIGVKHVDGLLDTIKKSVGGLTEGIDLSKIITFDKIGEGLRTALQLLQTNKDVLTTLGIAAGALAVAFATGMFVFSVFETALSAVFGAPAWIASKVVHAALLGVGKALAPTFAAGVFVTKALVDGLVVAMSALSTLAASAGSKLAAALGAAGIAMGSAMIGAIVAYFVLHLPDRLADAIRNALHIDIPLGPGDLPWKQHARGTSHAPGGWSLVGERGPELVNLKSGSTVLNAQQSMAAMSGGGGWGGGAPVTINLYGIAADKVSVGKAISEALAAYDSRSGGVRARR